MNSLLQPDEHSGGSDRGGADRAILDSSPQSAPSGASIRVPGIWAAVALLALQSSLAVYTIAVGSKPAERSWEYQIVAIPDPIFDTKMNELGKEGWELVSARRASDGSTYSPRFSYELILKRPARLGPAK